MIYIFKIFKIIFTFNFNLEKNAKKECVHFDSKFRVLFLKKEKKIGYNYVSSLILLTFFWLKNDVLSSKLFRKYFCVHFLTFF